ncbi:ABC transporter permease [Bosea caraganae]|uniref:ABC transporter permease n=1 Tax=Bosea caraganae TaxID=2763117 RepID=A0A370L7C0_9HYPH|nr:ABC transporter permease [Bosea caraganae]RDJ25511.1 ABC transporter permease [Bosea caraganae]RDJ25702.1 ABC transporter permease [Bosea caraganae]
MSDAALTPTAPTRIASWVVICFLLLPLLVIVPISLTDQDYLSMPVDGISLRHYANLFTSREWLWSFTQSLIIASISTLLAVSLGTLCAIGCWRLGNRISEAVRLLMLLPMIVPTIVYVLGFYRLLVDLKLLGTYLGVIISHVVTGIPYVVVIVSTALASFDLRYDQAARSLGATMSQSIRLVLLPNIKAAVASSAIFAFIHSWDELLIVLFIAGRSIFTLPRRIWDGINDKLDPTMAAVATMLLLISAALLFLDLALRKRES